MNRIANTKRNKFFFCTNILLNIFLFSILNEWFEYRSDDLDSTAAPCLALRHFRPKRIQTGVLFDEFFRL